MSEKDLKGASTEVVVQENAAQKSDDARRRTHDHIARIVVVVLAIVFWMFVKFTEMDAFEQTISGVRVEIRGVENIGFSAISGYDTTIDIVVRGEQSAVERLRATDIKAYVDVSDVTAAGDHSLKVQFDQLPEHISIAEQSVTTLIIYMDRDTTKEVPLTLSISSYTVEQNHSVGVPTSQVNALTVYGPQTVLEQVASVQIAMDVGHMQSSVTAMVDTRNVKVRYFAADGSEVNNPYLSVKEERFVVNVPLYTEKQLRLTLENASDFSDVAYTTSTVRVVGRVERLAALETLSLGVFAVQNGMTQQIALENVLPSDFTLVGKQSEVVTVTVTPKA